MTHFIKQGNKYMVADEASLDISPRLPVGTYVIKRVDMPLQYYLERVDDFELPDRLYGSTNRDADRVINTFLDRDSSTGVLLDGEKGSGKTLLAKVLSRRMADMGCPTLLLNQPHCGDEFNAFIQKIDTTAVVIMDEFEKVYRESEDQQAILTLLDGVYPSKKLFVLTCNDRWRLDSYFHNRPGRLFYQFEYSGLDQEFISEYCTEKLADKTQVESVVRVASVFSKFNFDMLKSLIEDMNRYGESPLDALRYLNCKPSVEDENHDVVVMVGNEEVPSEYHSLDYWRGSPLSRREIKVQFNQEWKKKGGDKWKTVRFTADNLTKFDGQAGVFIYEKDGITLKFTREKAPDFNYYKYA